MRILIIISALLVLVNADTIKVENVEIKTFNQGDKTHFTIVSSLAPGIDPNNAWIGLGFNSKMVNISKRLIITVNVIEVVFSKICS